MTVIDQHLTLELDPGRDGLPGRLAFELPSNVTELQVVLQENVAVDGGRGFDRVGDHAYVSEGSIQSPRLDVRLHVNETRLGGYAMYDAGDWALTRQPVSSYSYRYRGSDPGLRKRVTIEGDGVASSDAEVIYVGPYEEWREDGRGQTFRLVVPSSADPFVPPRTILESLTAAGTDLRVGSRDETVLAVAAPTGDVNWGPGGRQQGTSGFWVRDDTPVASPENTWIHEYVHTRQDFETTDSTEWLTEGMADYFEALLPYYQERISFESFHAQVSTTKDRAAVLADPDRWQSPFSDYYKGRRVLAALDAEIRLATDGERTIQTVLEAVNEANDPIRLVDFKRLLEECSDNPFDRWIDTYVRGQSVPTIPTDPKLFSPSPADAALVEEPTYPCPDCGTPVPSEGERCKQCRGEVGPERCSVCETDISDAEEYCPGCGVHLERVCPVCDTELTTEQYCSSCGLELVRLCSVCGERVDRAVAPDVEYCDSCGNEFEW